MRRYIRERDEFEQRALRAEESAREAGDTINRLRDELGRWEPSGKDLDCAECNLPEQWKRLHERVDEAEALVLKHEEHIAKLEKRIVEIKKAWLRDNPKEIASHFVKHVVAERDYAQKEARWLREEIEKYINRVEEKEEALHQKSCGDDGPSDGDQLYAPDEVVELRALLSSGKDSDEKKCHICRRPLSGPGEVYCSAAHLRPPEQSGFSWKSQAEGFYAVKGNLKLTADPSTHSDLWGWSARRGIESMRVGTAADCDSAKAAAEAAATKFL